MTQIDVSVVVPTYGGVTSIRELVSRVVDTLTAGDFSHEIIVVNDSSPDTTWEVLTQLQEELPLSVRTIDLLHNHGQAVATMCGLAHARGEIVVTMDDDLQHPPEEIPVLLNALESHPDWDAVIGEWERDHGVFRSLGSAIHSRLDRLAYQTPNGFRLTAFRAMRRPVVDALVSSGTRTPVITPMVLAAGGVVRNVPVAHHPRPYGTSTFTVRGGISRTIQNFLQGSTLPLRLLSRFGLIVSIIALTLGAFQLIRWLGGAQTPAGWMSSFLATLFFGGTILIAIGLQGEYLALLMKNATAPPRWSIRRRHGFSMNDIQGRLVEDNRSNATDDKNHSRISASEGAESIISNL